MADLIYIDPGSGSYLIQAIIAGALGAAFWIKMSWHRIRAFFSRKIKDRQESPQKNRG